MQILEFTSASHDLCNTQYHSNAEAQFLTTDRKDATGNSIIWNEVSWSIEQTLQYITVCSDTSVIQVYSEDLVFHL